MSEARAPAADLDALFRAERGSLWGIAYRLTGTAADADDVVQEAFARAASSASEPVAPWLVRVVTNLAIDVLRRRKRRRYEGPWLPAPCEEVRSTSDDPEQRYGLSESATFAFLIALEALAPRPRAALLLRDVLGYSARETATALATSEANVRVLHLRGRRALADYDRERCIPDAALQSRHRAALERLHECLLAQDTIGLEALFTESVRTVTDANGEYTALAQPMTGSARVARFYQAAALHRQSSDARSEIRVVNGLPALLTVLHAPVRRQAPRSVLRVELDGDGRIREVQVVLAPRKLGAVRFA
jgi:RNA polymerase sigma-70 factor (ECF subfamily)